MTTPPPRCDLRSTAWDSPLRCRHAALQRRRRQRRREHEEWPRQPLNPCAVASTSSSSSTAPTTSTTPNCNGWFGTPHRGNSHGPATDRHLRPAEHIRRPHDHVCLSRRTRVATSGPLVGALITNFSLSPTTGWCSAKQRPAGRRLRSRRSVAATLAATPARCTNETGAVGSPSPSPSTTALGMHDVVFVGERSGLIAIAPSLAPTC